MDVMAPLGCVGLGEEDRKKMKRCNKCIASHPLPAPMGEDRCSLSGHPGRVLWGGRPLSPLWREVAGEEEEKKKKCRASLPPHNLAPPHK